MSRNTFRLAEHYAPIQSQIFDEREDINALHEKYGERVAECLFLSHIVEKLESQFCGENLLAIASQLIEFELSRFQPPELIPIDEGQNFFKGEIVHFSDSALVLKINSYQFPTWQLLITVVARSVFALFPNIHQQSHFEFSAVSL
ncbi:hypothetical protein NF212_19450 [Parasalinivibrio latis]|uniref:hypothetical protein n=1 Tax=Parasalinivibrio latis TaxID=2952610 RepID=UPI0030E469C9